tara:strand:+ start:213 stop:569 length:357 start_codon:yes stop_codon:yes gene_type:complete
MRAKKVKQTITIDISNLEKTLKWHLGLNKTGRKLEQISKLDKMGYEEAKEYIVDLRLELSSLDTTLLEFQEIYEALTYKEEGTPEPVGPVPDGSEPDLQHQIDNRLIKSLQNALDNKE